MLNVQNLSKSFGDVQAIDQLNFSIDPGKILGLIGPNGSGKTTTFRIILNLLTPDQGAVLWNQQAIDSKDLNRIGYLPEERGLFLDMTLEEVILYFAALNDQKKADIKKEIPIWLEKFAVKGKKTDKVKSLSKGNQQKIQMINTLIHRPELIILDEPFSGLDPVNADLLIQAIQQAKDEGACIIFSSHNMDNVQQLCDQVLMLINGKESLKGSVEDIRNSFGRTRVELETEVPLTDLLAIEGVESAVEHDHGRLRLTLSDPKAGQAVFDRVSQSGYVQTFSQQAPSLNEIFKIKVGELND